MEQQAAKVLEQIIYATVASASTKAEPWNSPVYVVYDSNLNFYWASGRSSQHSRNIQSNSRVFLVIYDSTVPWGQGKGVFIEGDAAEVVGIDEVAKICQLRKARVPDAKHPPEEFLPDKPRSLYKVTPSKIWMNQDAKVNDYFVDERAELDPEKLRTLLATTLL